MNKSLSDLLFVIENLSEQRLRIERALLQQMSKQPLPGANLSTKSLFQEGLILAERAAGARNTLEKEFFNLLKKGVGATETASTSTDANYESSPQPVFAGTISVKLSKNNPSVTVPFTVHNHYSYPQSIVVECSDLYDLASGRPVSQSLTADPAFVRVESQSSVKINIQIALPESVAIAEPYEGNILLKGVETKFFRFVVSLNESSDPPAIQFSEPE